MNVLEYLKYIPLIAQYIKNGLLRVLGFFSTGWKSYLGMFVFVVSDHLSVLINEGPVAVIVSIGVRLGKADSIIAENLPILAGGEGISYFLAVQKTLIALFTVLWFIRTIATLMDFIEGSKVSPATKCGIGVGIWIISVITVERSLPTATFELIINSIDLFDISKINPFTDANTSANITELDNISSITNN